MNSIRFTEANASLDRNKPILSASEEIKTRIMSEKEKRFKVINEIDNFTDAYETFLDKCLNTESKSELEKEEKIAAATTKTKERKSVQSR